MEDVFYLLLRINNNYFCCCCCGRCVYGLLMFIARLAVDNSLDGRFPVINLASQLPHHISRLTCQQELLVQDLLGAMEICGKRGVKHVWKEGRFPTEREPVKTNSTHIKNTFNLMDLQGP